MAKLYAVRKGRQTGIFYSWEECKKQINGFSGAEFHSYYSEKECNDYLNGNEPETVKFENELLYPYAFIDGSFNASTCVYGFGGILKISEKDDVYILKGNGNDDQMKVMRNVAGEVLGSMKAITLAIKLGLPQINIYYDYSGIEQWANGSWQAKQPGTKRYVNFINNAKKKITINFIKVKAHSNIEGNETADILAKQAVGLI